MTELPAQVEEKIGGFIFSSLGCSDLAVALFINGGKSEIKTPQKIPETFVKRARNIKDCKW